MASPLRFDGRVVLVTGAGGGESGAGPTIWIEGLCRAAARVLSWCWIRRDRGVGQARRGTGSAGAPGPKHGGSF